MTEAKHYLAAELEELLRSDIRIWDFIRQSSLDGVWYWDLENPEHEWMSPEFWQAFGIDPATKAHKASEWQDMIFADDLAVAIDNFQKHCADPSHPYDQIVRYRHADGSTVWVRCRGLVIRDEQGVPKRMLGAHNDITALKSRELALAQEKQLIEQINEELRTFAYAVSHDLKAPANTTQMLLTELAAHHGQGLDEDGRELLGLAQRSVDRMRNLVEELLRYTRIIGEELVFERLDLNLLLGQVLDDLASDIQAADARIGCKELPVIHGNPLQIRTLLQNLIANAIKFRAAGTDCQITIQGEQSRAGHVRITVSDNGTGIPANKQEQIFGLFKRLHGQSIPGVGLGLPLCRRIAINHRGTLTVQSPLANGRGAAFTLTLPKNLHA